MTLIDLVGQETTLRRVASTHGGEYAGPCPWCGGQDRFRVWPHAGKPSYWCRQCGKKGDAIQYLRDRHDLSFREACKWLNLPSARPSKLNRAPQPPRLASPPPLSWQVKARAFTAACEDMLWTSTGAKALAFLHHRGLQDETIQGARVGYHAAERRESCEAWGLEAVAKKAIWLPRGIVFPWWVHRELWRIVIRRVGADVPKHEKYITVSGSSNTLYRVDTLRPNAPAMLVEGCIDALAIVQEAGDLIAVVAAGSTTGGRLERWIGRLALSLPVLAAFDADKAGEEAAAWWLKALGPRGKHWRPYWDDPAAMLQEGADLRSWVREGIGTEPLWWRELARWPNERRELWEERALLMEVEGGLLRAEAEYQAFTCLHGPSSTRAVSLTR